MNDEKVAENTQETTEPNERTAVADTKEAPVKEAPAESGAAQEDVLDELLKEFNQGKRGPQAAPPAVSEPTEEQPQLDVAALAILEKRLQAQEQRQHRRELEDLFSEFANGVQADAVDAEAFLTAQSLREPRLNQLWQERAANPKAWERVKAHLKQDFAKRWGKKVDKQVTESREAVASAVRSASTAAPQKELTDRDVFSLPKDEFDALQRKLGVTPV